MSGRTTSRCGRSNVGRSAKPQRAKPAHGRQPHLAVPLELRKVSAQLLDRRVEVEKHGEGVEAELVVGVSRGPSHEITVHLEAYKKDHDVLGHVLVAERDPLHPLSCRGGPFSNSPSDAATAWSAAANAWA